MTIELYGLELYGYHGVGEDERRTGQRFVFDLVLDTAGRAGETDALEDTVDYREVVRCVREVSDGTQFALLEALATAVADELLRRFPLEAVRVRVRKPDVKLEAPVDWSAVTVSRERA
jgi:dihydroneopterin aldolase